MNYFNYTKNLLGFALFGCVLFGSIFGFWFKGAELDAFRALGSILAVVLASVFCKNILHENFKKSE